MRTPSEREVSADSAEPAIPAWLATLYEHLAWADDHALASLRAAASPPPRAVELLAHVFGAEHVWLARIEERAPEVPVWPPLDVDGCARLAAANRAAFAALLARLAPGDLDRAVRYRNSAGIEFTSRIADILVHVALHGSYHRGQVALVVRDAGAEPSPTDFIAFVRGTPAATRRSTGS